MFECQKSNPGLSIVGVRERRLVAGGTVGAQMAVKLEEGPESSRGLRSAMQPYLVQRRGDSQSTVRKVW